MSAPRRFGAVDEKPNAFASSPPCPVSSRPHRDDSVGALFSQTPYMSTATSLTRGVVARLRNRRVAGLFGSPRYATSTKPPYRAAGEESADVCAAQVAAVNTTGATSIV